MKLEIVGKNYSVADKLYGVIEHKLEKFERHFDDNDLIRVVCREEGKGRHIMEITINFGGRIMRAEVSSDNMYDNIDLIIPKLERQVRKYRTKLGKQLRDTVEVASEEVEETPQSKLVRSKQFEVIPMTIDEAMLQIELLEHDFFVFLNETNGRIDVLYKRADGNYGLLDPVR